VSGVGLAIGHGAAGSPMIAHVGQTGSPVLSAALVRHGIRSAWSAESYWGGRSRSSTNPFNSD
jgi:hypothetical protein